MMITLMLTALILLLVLIMMLAITFTLSDSSHSVIDLVVTAGVVLLCLVTIALLLSLYKVK